MSRSYSLFALVSLSFALGLSGSPAQASEVVKLARLVVTGKRTPSESPKTGSESRSAGEHQGQAGGDDSHGTAPTPGRGVS